MAKLGLHHLMNIYPSGDENFIIKYRFRFIPPYNSLKKSRTIIDIESYDCNSCVVSFYDSSFKSSKNKFKERKNLGPGHTLSIFKACLEAYFTCCKNFAMIFVASNDIGMVEEENARMSAYKLFLYNYFPGYKEDECIVRGSMKLNTFLIYKKDFKYITEAEALFKNFEANVENNLNEEEDNSSK